MFPERISYASPFQFISIANPFAIEGLALIARGSRKIAAFGRREASQSSAQGVFEKAKLSQKRIGFLPEYMNETVAIDYVFKF